MATKKRQIQYFELTKKIWRKEEDNIMPFVEVKDLFQFILNKKRLIRIHQLKQSKICLLDSCMPHVKGDNSIVIKGLMKSATQDFCPYLLNSRTGEERPNTRTKQEGDIEKNHFLIKIIDRGDNEFDVFVIFEKNGNGIRMNQFVDCLNGYNKLWVQSKKEKRSYSINYKIVCGDDFFEMLNNLGRAKIAEVHFDKTLVGSDALDFSNKLVAAKSNVVLTIKAEKDMSLKGFGLDVLQLMQGKKKSKISKIRIYGEDEEKHNVMIDTEFFGKKTEIEAELNSETGEVITHNIYTELEELANALV